ACLLRRGRPGHRDRRVAQRESAAFTRPRSQVRALPRLPLFRGFAQSAGNPLDARRHAGRTRLGASRAVVCGARLLNGLRGRNRGLHIVPGRDGPPEPREGRRSAAVVRRDACHFLRRRRRRHVRPGPGPGVRAGGAPSGRGVGRALLSPDRSRRSRPFIRPAHSRCRRMTLSHLRKTRLGALALVIFGLILAATGPAAAQSNFEIQVYPSETVAPGTTMVALHSNVAAQGSTRTKDGVLRTQGAFHETLEITQGWTSWFETGFYVFTSIQPDTTWEWVGDHIRPRVRAPESWKLPVGLSLSAEIGYQQRSFSVDTWTLELRPIIDKQWERWYVSVNPVLDRAITGDSVKNGFEFSPAAKISYSVTPKVAIGLEYYGALGPVTNFDRGRDQQHQLFPVIDLDLGPKWEFNFGVGFG